MKRIISIMALAVLAVALLSVTACGSNVSPQDYNNLKGELDAAKNQLATANNDLAAAQAKLAAAQTAQTQLQDLTGKYDQLKKDYDAKVKEMADAEARYQVASTQYTELKKLYDAMISGAVTIATADIEQTIFNLINQQRANAGVAALQWGEHLYDWATRNNQTMITNGRMEYPEYVSWQEIFWASGYPSAETLAKGALANWKVNQYLYEKNILHKNAIYGAVSAVKSGDVFFITYMADIFK